MENEKLLTELFIALDNEIRFSINNNLEYSGKSLALLIKCEVLEIGKSKALKALTEKK